MGGGGAGGGSRRERGTVHTVLLPVDIYEEMKVRRAYLYQGDLDPNVLKLITTETFIYI